MIAAADTSTIALAARLVVSLAVVLGLLAGAAFVLRRRAAGARHRGRGAVDVVARAALGRTSSVQVVVVGGRALVVGVTEQQVTLLAEVDPADVDGLDPSEIAVDLADEIADGDVGERGAADLDAEFADVVAAVAPARPRGDVTRSRSGRPTGSGAARTARPGSASASGPARMSVIDALREKTVRR